MNRKIRLTPEELNDIIYSSRNNNSNICCKEILRELPSCKTYSPCKGTIKAETINTEKSINSQGTIPAYSGGIN